MSKLISPYGGTLKDMILPEKEAAEFKAGAKDFSSWDLTERQLWDLEMLSSGAFSPLEGFMNRADYDGVVDKMRLADGTLWPMPITLDITEAFAGKLSAGTNIALRNHEGVMLAVLKVSDVWNPDKSK